MTNWLPGIDYEDIARIDVVGVTLGGIRGGVETSTLDVHLWDGEVVTKSVPLYGITYETLVDDIKRFNASRSGSRRDRS